MDGHEKITYFYIFLKIYLTAIVEIVVTLRAIINSFEIYTTNPLLKKILVTNFIMSIALFWIIQPKQK